MRGHDLIFVWQGCVFLGNLEFIVYQATNLAIKLITKPTSYSCNSVKVQLVDCTAKAKYVNGDVNGRFCTFRKSASLMYVQKHACLFINKQHCNMKKYTLFHIVGRLLLNTLITIFFHLRVHVHTLLI